MRVPRNNFPDIAVLCSEIETSARFKLSNRRPIKFLPRRVVLNCAGPQLASAALDFLGRNQQIHPAISDTNSDPVAGLENGEVPTDCSLRRDIQNRRTIGGSTLTSVPHTRHHAYPLLNQPAGRIHIYNLG